MSDDSSDNKPSGKIGFNPENPFKSIEEPHRPYKKLEEKQVRPLAERQWTTLAIAAYLEVAPNTLRRQFGIKLNAWRQLGQANLLDRAWLRIQDKGYKNERLFIEMMKRYVWKTHLDKIRVERVIAPGEKNQDEQLKELYNEIQLAAKTKDTWSLTQTQSLPSESQQLVSQSLMGLLNQESQESITNRELLEEKLSISEKDT
jgi:hypothetical protein